MIAIKVKDLEATRLWLIAIDYGDGVARLTYKVGKGFLVSVIHFN